MGMGIVGNGTRIGGSGRRRRLEWIGRVAADGRIGRCLGQLRGHIEEGVIVVVRLGGRVRLLRVVVGNRLDRQIGVQRDEILSACGVVHLG